MSQITRCPACQTVFRVVRDQLRMSDGWVRCGQCTEVFDARATLAASATELSSIEMAMQVKVPPEVVASPPAVLAIYDIGLPEPSAHAGPDAASESNLDPAAAAPLEGDDAMNRVEDGPVEPVLLPDSLSSASHAALTDNSVSGSGHKSGPDIVARTPASLPFDDALSRPSGARAPEAFTGTRDGEVILPATAAKVPPDATDVSFMRTMPGEGQPVSKMRRFLTGMLILAFSALLLLQVSVLERDRFAAMFPQYKPALMWMCEQLGCNVAALRQIESVVIDSSSFNRAKGDTYRLGLALRNTASVDVAVPSVELTLTDSQDQPLLRRIFSASELGKPGSSDSVLAAGAEWQGQATLTVRLAPNAERFTGYRVLAFYP